MSTAFTLTDRPSVTVKSRADLRDWLAAAHATSDSVWLVTYKKHTGFHLSVDEVVDELLCWGWIDSRTATLDDARSCLLIAPRNPRSGWSRLNKEKVARLRAEGRMMPPGEAAIAAAQANGMWDFLDDVDRLVVPGDLSSALGDLISVWDGWPRSVRRGTLEWIKTAKRPPTRANRIADVAESAAAGQRPSPFRR